MPDAPLADAERDRIVARLNAAYAAGEVDAERYPQILDAAFGAQTLGEIAPVVELLPIEATYDIPAAVETGTQAPGQLSRTATPSPLVVSVLIVIAVATVLLLLAGIFGLSFWF